MLHKREDGGNMITKRKLNKKLELIIHRQNLLAAVMFRTHLEGDWQKKMEEKWNDLWFSIMEGKDGKGI